MSSTNGMRNQHAAKLDAVRKRSRLLQELLAFSVWNLTTKRARESEQS